MSSDSSFDVPVAIIGAGPAGLMAAEVLSRAGVAVHVFDALPSAGRKFLLAGKGGLNLTHSEPLPAFIDRYVERAPQVARWLEAWGPDALRDWAHGLGVETFVGTSGRVFPVSMKAAPLLRAWLHRLRHPDMPGAEGVQFHMRHRWLGGPDDDAALRFQTEAGERRVTAQATVLALGGASWPHLGSNGAWVPWLQAQGADVSLLRPANCGFDVAGGWSPYFAERHAGQPLKSVVLRFTAHDGTRFERRGEFVTTATGIEGSLVYAASRWLRETVAATGEARIEINLRPDRAPAEVLAEVRHPRGSRSLASHLKSRLGLSSLHLALLHEVLGREGMNDAARVAHTLQALPLTLAAARPVAEAISTAGGVSLESLDDQLALRARPDVFCAGEMLDWEAPTGGYLLTAVMASGVVAAQGVLRRLGCQESPA
jgi:uncharacterized flavoprotein (TIGR03862 family)